jgi:2-keto-4-pentenoate hydratase/2-oxohepta-3-ene-1,7-dioic acid hydratase in catechol pathway
VNVKFASFRTDRGPSFGLVVDHGIVDLASRLSVSTLAAAIEADLLAGAALLRNEKPDYAWADVTSLPVIPEPKHIFCIGVNYADHLTEVRNSGIQRPKTTRPPLFVRYPETIVGNEHPLIHPGVSRQFDYEAELAVIIGKGGRYIEKADALAHVAGYSCFNDGSIRDWQFHTTQIIPGKNFFQTGSFGPWMVTPDEIGDPKNLNLKLLLNGQELQNGNTRDLIFDVSDCISYISALLPLQPGDVIATGTPSGVGLARDPQIFMKPGDVCEVVIDNIGTLRNTIVEEPVRSHWAA